MIVDADVFPASFGQERLWFFHQLDPDLPLYQVLAPVPLPFPITPAQVAEAVRRLVRRHETLRTALDTRDGTLLQVVRDEVPVSVTHHDLRGLPAPEQRPRARALITADAVIPFRLDEAPLWRAQLIEYGDDGRWLQFTLHHAIVDGRSVAVLITELTELCRAVVEDREPRLPDLPIQYGDFAAWQRDQLSGGGLDAQLAYWAERLGDLPAPLELPADRARPAKKTYAGGELVFDVPVDTVDALNRLARGERATPFMVALAAYGTLLSRLSGQSDILVGTPIDRRGLPELTNLIGMLVNTVVFRLDLSGTPTFRELVRRIRQLVFDALDNGDVPFDRLVELYQRDRDPSRSPLYQAGFNMIEIPEPSLSNGTAKFDILLDLAVVAEERLIGRIEYSSDLFDHASAEVFAARLLRLLAGGLAAPDTPIDALSIMDDDERDRVLAAGRSVVTGPAPGGLITDRFDAVVAAHPDTVAVRDADGRHLTYADLDARANRLAHRLVELGVRVDSRVALCCATDADLVVAALGVLKAGGCYLPLDPDYPPDRLAFFLRDTAAVAVVAHRRLTGRLPADGPPVVAVDEPLPGPDSPPAGRATPSSLAYALFTSGSTGTPKAVAVEHRNVLAYLDGLAAVIDQRPGDGYAMLQPLTFDFCVTMFYGALLSGGTLHLAPRDLAADAGFVAQLVREAPVDHLKITPSHLAALRAAVSDPAELMPRRTLLLGGESSRWSWFADLRATPGPAVVVNHYGPTETTVGVLALPGDRTPRRSTVTTPIGWPLAHAVTYVLDDRRQPVPDGVVGELWVGGPQVTRGYLGRADLTAERFVPDPFSGRRDDRMYRTGDRVRRLPDGAVEFLGRVDDQVKVRGYRIEVNEVRLALATHPHVDDCAVVVRGEQLVGYVVPDRRAAVDLAAVRAHLAGRLPEFMVPTTFVVLDELPLTPHGKLDRRRLPEPGGTAQREPETLDTPQTATEETVAALFGRLLDRENVGRTDSFFALGGHSLLATQLVSRLRATFDRPIALRAVFERPTVADLARAIEETARKGSRRLPQISPVPRDPAPVASYGQTRLWFLDQLEQAGQLYNTNLRLRLTGPIDAVALRRALTGIVDRHEVLRTRLVRDGGRVVQVVVDTDLPFAELELSDVDGPDRDGRLADALAAHGDRGFDLAAEPPLRALFVRLAPELHELLVTIHHAATDAWSAGILVRELRALYAAFRDGSPDSPLPPLPVQYADFAVWQRELVESRLRATQLAYWRRQLDGAPSRLPLPTDRPAPARRTYEGGHVPLELPVGVADRLRTLGADHDATLFMVLLAAFYALLARHSDATDLVVGTPAANRPRPEVESMIGFFLNTLVLRVDAGGDPTFVELVDRVRRTTLDAYGNADVPFEALVEELQPERDLGGTPLVPVLFTLEDTERETGEVGDATITWAPMGTSLSRFDVSLFLWRRAGNLTGALEYRTDLFDRETVERLGHDFTRLVTEAAADPGRPLSRLAPLSTEDNAVVDAASRGPVREYPPLLPIRYAPESVVVDENGVEVTGTAFAARVDGLAARLVQAGVGVGSPVGISLPRGIDLLVAVHAVLRAGGAFVSLEPDFPDGRLRDMASRAGVDVVVTDNAPLWTDRVVVSAAESASGVD
ncbi:non-ribosomal peptide synthetase, partial [Virgisporangium aurantiacum]|uniref:non-ribosomal peptide synthetase n=1 Tax=Virgisporangium aurantiacum TaxID=175570 RepID=UPI00194F39CA